MNQFASIDMRDRFGTPLFSHRAVSVATVASLCVATGVFAAQFQDRSELLMPINPVLQATAIGLGICVGILLDAVRVSAWQRHMGGVRDQTGLSVIVSIAIIPVLCVMGATYGARRLVEYRAFSRLPIVTRPADFVVTGVFDSRHGPRFSLRGAPGERTISLRISYDAYRSAHIGDHVSLPVQTGRGGIQRMIPPMRLIMSQDVSPRSTGAAPAS